MKPVLNWSGGKRQILCEIEKYIPKTYKVYYEPFLGGGAVLFHLQPKNAVVNDINAELMNLYKVIKCDVKTLIADLRKHKMKLIIFTQLGGLTGIRMNIINFQVLKKLQEYSS